MAIQIPNLGTGNGSSGENELVIRQKYNSNFSDTTNAASRLLGTGAEQVPLSKNIPSLLGTAATKNTGTATGQIPLSEDVLHSFFNTTAPLRVDISEVPSAAKVVSGEIDVSKIRRGAYYLGSSVTEKRMSIPEGYADTQALSLYALPGVNEASTLQLIYKFNAQTDFNIRAIHNGSVKSWAKVYTDINTTKDTATGFLKASSPVLHVYNDSVTKIHEAEQLDITVDKKGVGHYEIHGTTGLRKNDGWFMSPPRDVHGNVLCMVDLEEKDGVVILRTYKKKFDFEIVSIVHDYDNPMDIPEGVCVEFRFNDLPIESLDDTQMEV